MFGELVCRQRPRNYWINLAPGSFDTRRELAIEVLDDIIDRLHSIVHNGWETSRTLDLTDEGLHSELEGLDENVEEDLDHKKAS